MNKVYVIGMGPGAYEQMTLKAVRTLEKCDVIVGYTVYIELLKEYFPDKRYLTTSMRQEAARCRMAFEEAAKGAVTAMVCSGDAGIYGMAGLMYEIGEESGELEFCHNPFSMPQGGMDALNNQDPLDILAYQYDLVCNGVELSSGAVRNHDPEIMIKAFELVGLGEDDVKAKFPAMYNAFCYGAPPHAGIAPGVDRMIMLICGEESIREIIPFPMNKNAMDIMMGAPATVEQKQLDDVHIAIKMPKED